jgi:hypothetical protein
MEEDRRAEIEKRAYALWEADGSPEGKAWEYWLRAERELSETWESHAATDPLEPMEHGPAPGKAKKR